MIKFIPVALIAIVAILSHASATDEDNQETSLLLGHASLFSGFCQRERQAIKADIKSRVNQQSSEMYKLFFDTFLVEISDEVLEVSAKDIEKFTSQIAEPRKLQTPHEEPLSEDDVQELLEDGVNQLQKVSLFGRIRNAGAAVATTMWRTATSGFYIRLAKLRTMMNKENFLQALVDACHQVRQYETKLDADLEEAKEKMIGEHDDEEIKQFIESMSVRSLQCQTTRFVSRLEGTCTLLTRGAPYLMKILYPGIELVFPPPSALAGEIVPEV